MDWQMDTDFFIIHSIHSCAKNTQDKLFLILSEKLLNYNLCLYVKRHSWWKWTYLKDKHKDEEECHIDDAVYSHANTTDTYHKQHYSNHPNPEFGQQTLNKVTQPVHGLAWLLGLVCIWKTCNNSTPRCWGFC